MSRYLIVNGDSRRLPLADRSVHCVVTSPPYWGLRDYGVEGQIGLEPTPDEFVRTMVDVFREVRRVLRDDGTLWLNLGDSYAGNGLVSQEQTDADIRHAKVGNALAKCQRRIGTVNGLKPKDLIGVPWRVALALQADGWYLRSDIIWAKPNPMPESVADRPTKAHEYLFLLSKSERYFFDAEAVRETAEYGRCGWKANAFGRNRESDHRDVRPNERGSHMDGSSPDSGRNLRTVWSIPTEAYPGSHFATFPRKLVEPCIKAGTSERGCCPACGAGWERETSVGYDNPGNRSTNGPRSAMASGDPMIGTIASRGCRLEKRVTTVGWRPACSCNAGPPVPAVVFDPFAGSGTTLVVANALGRIGVGCELNPEYIALARRRLDRPHAPVIRPRADEVLPLFAEVESMNPN